MKTSVFVALASLAAVACALTIGVIASGGVRTAHAQTPIPTPAATPVVLPPTNCVDVDEVQVCISLAPHTATNTVGDEHTVTATVTEDAEPVEGIPVAIVVETGPNDDEFDAGFTNASGQFSFTYTGDGGPGTDALFTCVLPDIEAEECTELIDGATKEWLAPTPTPSPTPTPTPTPTAVPPTPTPTPTAVLAAQQLPAGGGTPSDGGSSSLPWLAIAAGVIAITSGGLALAYRTRHTR